MANYGNLTGDLDADPRILTLLNNFAKKVGRIFHVVSGARSYEEQKEIYDTRAQRGLVAGKTVARPGYSKHQTGEAADVTVGGVAIQGVFSRARIIAAGLMPLAGDAPHVELPGAKGPQGNPRAGVRSRTPGNPGTTPKRPRTSDGNSPSDWLKAAGWPDRLIPTMIAIGWAESGLRVDAVSPPNTNGTRDRGWLQINDVHGYDHQKLVTDPVYTAKAGLDVYKSQGFGAWSVFNSGAYKTFLGRTPAKQPGRSRPGAEPEPDTGGSGGGSADGGSDEATNQLVAFWGLLPGEVPNPLDLFKKVPDAIGGVTDFLKWISWIFHPLNLLRVIEFWAGMQFIIMGFIAIIVHWKGASAEDVVKLLPQGRALKVAGKAGKATKVGGKAKAPAKAKTKTAPAPQLSVA